MISVERHCERHFMKLSSNKGKLPEVAIKGILRNVRLKNYENISVQFNYLYKRRQVSTLYKTGERHENFAFSVNPLQPSVAFLYPLKTSLNLKVF